MPLIPIAKIAALSDCMEGIDMRKVNRYRSQLDEMPPISLFEKNEQGYHVLDDGNHRVMAAMLEGRTRIAAKIQRDAVSLSWRWPRISPVLTTLELMKLVEGKHAAS